MIDLIPREVLEDYLSAIFSHITLRLKVQKEMADLAARGQTAYNRDTKSWPDYQSALNNMYEHQARIEEAMLKINDLSR